MARKIVNTLGTFEEMDSKDIHRNMHFLRIKETMDLKQPLERGTLVCFKEKIHRVFSNMKDSLLSVLSVEE